MTLHSIVWRTTTFWALMDYRCGLLIWKLLENIHVIWNEPWNNMLYRLTWHDTLSNCAFWRKIGIWWYEMKSCSMSGGYSQHGVDYFKNAAVSEAIYCGSFCSDCHYVTVCFSSLWCLLKKKKVFLASCHWRAALPSRKSITLHTSFMFNRIYNLA